MHISRHYSRAPITEALIDLRIEAPDGIEITAIADIHTDIKADYPQRQEHLIFQGQFSGVGGISVSATTSQSQTGYLFSNIDRNQIFQARLDGFTFSRLAPYEKWEPFRDEAQRLWNIYRSATNPKSVIRLAVRYVNQLNLPLPLHDFKDYLRTVPEVSSDLPQFLSGYFMQLQIPQQDIQGALILNETILASDDPGFVPVLLDIDLFRENNLPDNEKLVWELIEQLHVRADEVFEACITERARELIN